MKNTASLGIDALADFVERCTLLASEIDASGRGDGAGNAVQLMTLHRAKGKEFQHVSAPSVSHRPRFSVPAAVKTGYLQNWIPAGTKLCA